MSKKKQDMPKMSIGKHKGKALAVVFMEEPSYLCWFYDTVDGYEEVKRAIAVLPEFHARLAKYRERKQLKEKTLEQRIEEVVARMFAVEPSPAEVDALCDELFHGHAVAERLSIIEGLHFGKYVQSGENLCRKKTGDEQYQFQVREDGREYEPWTVTPESDLSEVPSEILQEMDYEMSYCGETDERDAKFSETRKHIQRVIGERSPS